MRVRKRLTKQELIRQLIRLAEQAADRSKTRQLVEKGRPPGDPKPCDLWEQAEETLLDLGVRIESETEEEKED